MTREGETLGRGRDGVGLAERIYLIASIAPRRLRFQGRDSCCQRAMLSGSKVIYQSR